MFEVYKPAGGFGVSTFFYLLVSLIAATLLAIVYAFGLRYIPFIYISVVMTGVFGVALGMLGAMVVKRGHCRNTMLAALIGLLLCLFGVAAKHYVQYRMLVEAETEAQIKYELNEGTLKPSAVESERKEIRKWVMDQVSFLGHFKARANQGMAIGRRGNGAPMKGVFIYSIWAIELGIVLYLGLMPSVNAAKEPYSEKLGMWADETEEAMYLPISSNEMVEQIKSATTVEELLEIPIPKSLGSQRHAMYDIHSVPGVEMEDAYLSVKLLIKSIDKEGKEQLEETYLVKNAILSSSQRVQLLENASLLEEALEDYRQALVEDEMTDEEA